MRLVGHQRRIHLRLSLINHNWRLDTRLVYLGLHVDNHILLRLLDCDTLLYGYISGLQRILVLCGQVSLTQLQRLHPREALLLHDLLELHLHVRADRRQVLEEHTRRELGRLVVQAVHGEADARTLVVVAVPPVQRDQVLHVELVLEDSPEVDHKPILGASLDDAPIGCGRVTELHGLHLGGVLDELVHEADKVVA